jgi:toxin ParE1/3/4
LKRLAFSSEAGEDLLDIAAWIASDNPERALSFVGDLEARCAGLLDFPEQGTSRPELAWGLRSVPFGNYIIFYTPGDQELRIERILHGARDIGGKFGREA